MPVALGTCTDCTQHVVTESTCLSHTRRVLMFHILDNCTEHNPDSIRKGVTNNIIYQDIMLSGQNETRVASGYALS